MKKPNIVFVFSDQHRAEATGYAGNRDVQTPVMDELAQCSLDFRMAVSGAPVCSPARASLLTGVRALSHGVFVNDVPLDPQATTIGKVLKGEGYRTGYIGKWHIDGHGRSSYIPRERRQGFDYWQVLECTHNYNESYYYGDEPQRLQWEGYDAQAQTRCAVDYIRRESKEEQPFVLFLSWGPPHAPYHSAPQEFRELYDPRRLTLRPNVPADSEGKAREELAGYYAHITALDRCLGELWAAIREEGIEEQTIFIYTSDHGDMLGSQGMQKKQQPWEESIRVPFLMHYPQGFGAKGRGVDTLIETIDVMPTLLGLCGVEVPGEVEGVDHSRELLDGRAPQVEAVLIECPHPFGQWNRDRGGREYRGIRTGRYTYVRDLNGPWLLYDNWEDPYQMNNLIGSEEERSLAPKLERTLQGLLERYHDEFLPGERYIEKWSYTTDETGTVPIRQ